MTSSAFEHAPIVRLEGWIQDPFDVGIAAARTCYSSKGIVRAADVNKDEKSRALGDRIATSTREAGHLTTRQHAHFVFSIDRVSRHTVWSFLHSHPFYNSEQVSQRYVRVTPGNVAVPKLNEAPLRRYRSAIDLQMNGYEQLITLLLPEVEKAYFTLFPSRLKTKEKYRATCLKRAYEIARYALPLATHTYLYHTVSALTLLRYARYCQIADTPTEQRELVTQMLDAVKAHDPHFAKDIVDPIPLEDTPEFQFFESFNSSRNAADFCNDFDRRLGPAPSRLVDYSMHGERTLAESIRSVLGLSQSSLSDTDAISLLLDPKKNALLSDTLNLSTLSKTMRSLTHLHYTFAKKLSHTADSQDQRHRMTPASRPILEAHFTGKPDYLTPPLITQNAQAHNLYTTIMTQTWQAIDDLLNDGLTFEWASYLLPNALAVRFHESGDLLAFHHKWKVRSCYTAQEEIFHATVSEIAQVKAVHPTVAAHILAPCYLRHRAGITPYCPEGDRFCGIRVWKQSIEEYKRLL